MIKIIIKDECEDTIVEFFAGVADVQVIYLKLVVDTGTEPDCF